MQHVYNKNELDAQKERHMNTREAFDERIMKLIRMYYDPDLQQMDDIIRERLKEVLYLAEDIGLLSWEEYETCLDTILFMGLDVGMEDRQW